MPRLGAKGKLEVPLDAVASRGMTVPRTGSKGKLEVPLAAIASRGMTVPRTGVKGEKMGGGTSLFP